MAGKKPSCQLDRKKCPTFPHSPAIFPIKIHGHSFFFLFPFFPPPPRRQGKDREGEREERSGEAPTPPPPDRCVVCLLLCKIKEQLQQCVLGAPQKAPKAFFPNHHPRGVSGQCSQWLTMITDQPFFELGVVGKVPSSVRFLHHFQP